MVSDLVATILFICRWFKVLTILFVFAPHGLQRDLTLVYFRRSSKERKCWETKVDEWSMLHKETEAIARAPDTTKMGDQIYVFPFQPNTRVAILLLPQH